MIVFSLKIIDTLSSCAKKKLPQLDGAEHEDSIDQQTFQCCLLIRWIRRRSQDAHFLPCQDMKRRWSLGCSSHLHTKWKTQVRFNITQCFGLSETWRLCLIRISNVSLESGWYRLCPIPFFEPSYLTAFPCTCAWLLFCIDSCTLKAILITSK